MPAIEEPKHDLTYDLALSDPRPHRSRYMYFPIQGERFIHAYLANREAAISRLLNGLHDTSDHEIRQRLKSIRVSSNPATWPVAVSDAVTRALVDWANEGTRALDRHTQRAISFARKVEISGTLRASYGPDDKPVSDEAASIEVFPGLALWLALDASANRSIRTLNALLKVGDIVSFASLGADLPSLQKIVGAKALLLERDCIQKLFDSGVVGWHP